MSSQSHSSSPSKRFAKEVGLFVLDILYNAVIIVVLVVLIRSYLISPFRVIGASMADTLASKEFILIDKLSYQLGEPKRGDPVVFRPPITNKYSYKFQGQLTLDETGNGSVDLSGLSFPKQVIYCQHPWVASFWFCQDKVKSVDSVFILPSDAELDSKSLNWKTSQKRLVTEAEAQGQQLMIQGQPNQTLAVRIYDDSGPEYFVKRIIGVPGDTLKIENGRVYLKTAEGEFFEEIQEPYLNKENLHHTYWSQTIGVNSVTVPEGGYFVMGDNRNHSNDSRSWFAPITQEFTPFVPFENVSGKVLLSLWPPQSIRLIPGASLE